MREKETLQDNFAVFIPMFLKEKKSRIFYGVGLSN